MAERSYLTSEVRGSGLECPAATAQELPRGATLCPSSGAVAEWSYPAYEASGGREETPRVRGQGRPGEATSHLRPGAETLRSHREREARDSSWEEPPTPEARPGGATRGSVAAQAQEGLEELSHNEGQERWR